MREAGTRLAPGRVLWAFAQLGIAGFIYSTFVRFLPRGGGTGKGGVLGETVKSEYLEWLPI